MTSSILRSILFWATLMIAAVLLTVLYPGWWVFIPVAIGGAFTLVEKS